MIVVTTATAAVMIGNAAAMTGAAAMIGIDTKVGTVATAVRDPLRRNTAALNDDVMNVIKLASSYCSSAAISAIIE